MPLRTLRPPLFKSNKLHGGARLSAVWSVHPRCLHLSQSSALNESPENDEFTSRDSTVPGDDSRKPDRKDNPRLQLKSKGSARYMLGEDSWRDEELAMEVWLENRADKDLGRKSAPPGSLISYSTKFQPSNTLRLGGIGLSLKEYDIRHLVPRKEIIPAFRDSFDIVRVSAVRDPKTLAQEPFYQLEFESAKAAKHFAEKYTAIFSKPVEEWPRDTPFPPGSKPTFAVLDTRSTLLENRRVVKRKVFIPHAGPGECVLLSVHGPGPAGGGKHRRPPKTEEIWKLLEDKEIKLCDVKSTQRKGRGVEIVDTDGAKIITKSGILKKWIVRCFDHSEAQRVVRDFHMKRPWEPSECMLLAEIID